MPLEVYVSTTAPSASLERWPSNPGLPEISAFADQEIEAAATELFPHALIELGEQVPSVTDYVRRIRVDGCPLYAKYAFLGVSLVSLLRGVRGPWPAVHREQQGYVQRPDGLAQREAAQLQLLQEGHLRTCRVTGLRRGVLFTQPVAGRSLAHLLLTQPQETAELLAATCTALADLHHPATLGRLAPGEVIGERSIVDTFSRKFNGISGGVYLATLGAERCAPEACEEIADTLPRVAARLRKLRSTVLFPAPQRVLIYGDLKPEHVFFPEGGAPVFIDPGLMPAAPLMDIAKLIGRTGLLLAATRPGPRVSKQVVPGIEDFISQLTCGMPAATRRAWLRKLLVLWVMDSVNILSTYLSAPGVLPLPAQAEAITDRAVELCRMLDEISSGLTTGNNARTTWENTLDRVQELAA